MNLHSGVLFGRSSESALYASLLLMFVIKSRRCRVLVEPKADLKMIVSDEDDFLFDMFF